MKVKENFSYTGSVCCNTCKYCYKQYDSTFDETDYYCFCDIEDEIEFSKKYWECRRTKNWDFLEGREVHATHINYYMCDNWSK